MPAPVEDQREAKLRALSEYAPGSTAFVVGRGHAVVVGAVGRGHAVFDVDFGHTDPQLVLPCGGAIRVDGPARRITVTY